MKGVKKLKIEQGLRAKMHTYITEVLLLCLIIAFFVTLSYILNTSINQSKSSQKLSRRGPNHYSGLALAADSTTPLPELMPEESDLSDELINRLNNLPPPSADCAVVQCVALTFDDGPDAVSTTPILDALAREHVLATFFLIGNRVQNNAAQVRRMYEDGHLIENHSWAHPDFIKLNAAQTKQQVELTQNAITSLGLPAPTMFRPPYGNRSNTTRQNVNLPIIMWNVDPKDWREKDPNRIVELVESQAKPGAIILMHDRVATAAALPKILHDLKQRYHLVTVKELLNLPDNARGEFFGR